LDYCFLLRTCGSKTGFQRKEQAFFKRIIEAD
jgi:hypothetical protein